jgi:hypothetical protein
LFGGGAPRLNSLNDIKGAIERASADLHTHPFFDRNCAARGSKPWSEINTEFTIVLCFVRGPMRIFAKP